jgi:hypothetical protein
MSVCTVVGAYCSTGYGPGGRTVIRHDDVQYTVYTCTVQCTVCILCINCAYYSYSLQPTACTCTHVLCTVICNLYICTNYGVTTRRRRSIVEYASMLLLYLQKHFFSSPWFQALPTTSLLLTTIIVMQSTKTSVREVKIIKYLLIATFVRLIKTIIIRTGTTYTLGYRKVKQTSL